MGDKNRVFIYHLVYKEKKLMSFSEIKDIM